MLQHRSADQLSSAGSPEPRCCSRQSLQDEVEDVATSCHLAQHFLHQPSINSQATAVAIDNSDYEPKTALLASAHPAAKPHYHDLLHAVLAIARSPTTRDCQRRAQGLKINADSPCARTCSRRLPHAQWFYILQARRHCEHRML